MRISRSQFAAIQYRMQRRAQAQEAADHVRSAKIAARLSGICEWCGVELEPDKPHDEVDCEEAAQ